MGILARSCVCTDYCSHYARDLDLCGFFSAAKVQAAQRWWDSTCMSIATANLSDFDSSGGDRTYHAVAFIWEETM